MKWDHVFTSDLPRAHKTTEIILSGSLCDCVAVNQTPLLRELSFGVREALPRGTSIPDAKAEVAKRLNIPVSEVIDTVESYASVKVRQAEFLTRLRSCAAPSHCEPAKILCVSHGAFIKSLLKHFCPSVPPVIKVGNCSLSIIHITWEQSEADMEAAVKRAKQGHYLFQCHALPEEVNMCLD
jgi:broad specificity phosphatase PhoE